MQQFLDRYFQLSERKTTVRKEVVAGVTTFATMAYILFVNPSILSESGMEFGAVMVATALSASLATLLMGLWANYPFALAPGMGLNAYFTYSIVMGQGVSWQTALGAVFLSAVAMLLLNLLHVRRLVIQAIPRSVRLGTTIGIGLFLAFIGLKNVGVVVPHPATFVTLGDFTQPSAFLTGLGVLIMATLMHYNVRGAILIGLLVNWLLGLMLGLVEWQGVVALPPSLAPTFLQLDIAGALQMGMVSVVLSILFISLFDTAGTMLGLAERAGFLDEKGGLPKASRTFTVDAVGGVGGALLGTSTITVFLESMAGIAGGARTGLASVVVGLLFLGSLFFEPLAASIPPFATSPALILVGAMMLRPAQSLEYDDYTELIPAFLVLLTIPLTYSIATGIGLGLIAWPLLKLLSGRASETHWLTWLLAALFSAKFVFLPN